MKKLLAKYEVKRYSVSVSGPIYDRLRAATAEPLLKVVDGLIVSALDDAALCAKVVERIRTAARPAP